MANRELRYFEVAALRPYEKNARKHSKRQLEVMRASIRRFGFGAPVVVWRDGMLLAGHGRTEAAKAEGLTTIPGIDVSDLSLTDARAYCLADNRIADMAAWDHDILKVELAELHEVGIDFEATGFNPNELAKILPDFDLSPDLRARRASQSAGREVSAEGSAAGEAAADPADDVDALVGPAVASEGEVWRFGDHRLVVGDCSDPAVLGRVCGDGEVALLVTDPPYGVDIGGRNRQQNKRLGKVAPKAANESDIQSDALSAEGLREFLAAAFTVAAKALRPGGVFYAFAAPGDKTWSVMSALMDADLSPRHGLIWVKDRIVLSRADINYRHEPIYYGWRPGAAHAWHGPTNEESVWQFDRPRASKAHPTMKPVALLERAIRNSSAPGELVLDIFAGSGSTLEAAHNRGRRAALVELEPKFADVILRRAIAHLGLAPVREDGASFEEVAAAREAA